MRELKATLSAIAFIVVMTAPLPATAYTQEDANACTPDAMQLCSQAIPDVTRITQCLIQKRRQLSPACTAVFNRLRAAGGPHARRALVQDAKF